MWKNQEDEESDDSDKIREKKKGRFKTVSRVDEEGDEDECEIFETELVDSDEPLSGEEESRVDDTVLTGTD